MYTNVRCEVSWNYFACPEPTFPDKFKDEIERERQRQLLASMARPGGEGALYVPLSLVEMCVYFISARNSDAKELYYSALLDASLPQDLQNLYAHFAYPFNKKHYTMVPMSSVPPDEIKIPAFPVKNEKLPQKLLTRSVHPKKTSKRCLQFSVDLIASALNYVKTLQAIDKTYENLSYAGVNAAIGRYVDFLHMLSEHEEEDLLAPLDVEMVWLSHLIRTEDYRTTSLYFGSLINHDMGRERHDDEQRKRNTSKLWKRYGAMKLYDFNLDVGYLGRLNGSNVGYFGLKADSILRDRQWFKYFVRDLKQARQRWFCKMRRESLRSENELSLWENLNEVDWFCKLVKEDEALANTMLAGYEKSLYLMARWPHRVHTFSPPFLVDLLWHAHQANPVAYVQDMKKLFGIIFDHRPWPTTSTPIFGASSMALWTEEFSQQSFYDCEVTHLFS